MNWGIVSMASLPFRTQKTTAEKNNSWSEDTIEPVRLKRHRIQRSPLINRSVLEVPNFFPTVIFTSIKRSRSPFFQVPTACFYYLPMYWTVTESRITQKKKNILNPFFSTKIKVNSIFERDSVHQVVSHSLNNTHEKNDAPLIGWKRVHFSCNTIANYKKRACCQNLVTLFANSDRLERDSLREIRESTQRCCGSSIV